MEKIILVVHLLAGLAIIGMILLQQGKGAEAGASFGAGASQTVLGSAGGWNFFSKVTGIFATIFFITSFGLAVIAKDAATVGSDILPELETVQQSLASELPDTGAVVTEASDIPVLEGEVAESAQGVSQEIPELNSSESKSEE
jgi:preprotein translocase subunit SecG